ncbi:MAG: potassium/proton antiporter [Bacteroidales bacterium]|nr:potassium/proton antiporter [Bacteroidales bacterium]
MIELFLLIASILFFVSILACKAGYKFGVPILLLFLLVGMIFGVDGVGIQFSDMDSAQTIGTIALCIILFSGGLDTKLSDIKPVIKEGIVLATVGVFLTAIITGVIIKFVFDLSLSHIISISLTSSLLLASTMASTDSASVFSILRSKGLNLKNNLRPLLEAESGSNDPVAYMMTITLISLVKQGGDPDYLSAVLSVGIQLIVGAIAGIILGKLFVWLINRLDIDNASLYPIAVFSVCIFIFSASYFMHGNSYLAVYLGGLIIGNSRFVHKRSSVNFFDGLAWLSQLIMFLTLGLLVSPHELIPVIIPGLIISIVMIFISRPLSVLLCLLPFKRKMKDIIFVSWGGLKGAVPIIFAIMALSENVPHAQVMFNIVFFCTLVSLVLQGTSLPAMAKKLNIIDNPEELCQLKNFDMEFSDDIKSVTTEISISQEIIDNHGHYLWNLPLPENTLVVMVKRDGKYFVPKGKTELKAQDKLLLITDNRDTLIKTLTSMGVNSHSAENETENHNSILNDIKNSTPYKVFRYKILKKIIK